MGKHNQRMILPSEVVEAAKRKEKENMRFRSYLKQVADGEWQEIHQPCGFLDANGDCILGENRPESCKRFPYTDQPERLFSLFSFLNAVGVCPAAYEICERLKQLYGFGRCRKQHDDTERFDNQAPGFSFVAGYTSWGFPYGVPEASEEQKGQEADEELPF